MENLISEIETYCEQRKMKLTTFGAYAVGDSKFFKRIKNGGQCLPSTQAKVRAYMAAHPAQKSQAA